MIRGRARFGWLVAWLALASAAPAVARAQAPEVEARLSALGPARAEEQALFAQIAGALETAETAAAEGDSARAERHRDLALALVRSLEARRRIAELRARLAERERSLASARSRAEAARAAAAQAAADAARLEGP